ncbi:hypothetical protein BH10PLA2_BH10PLA2_24400 [soil metagenome]
MKRQLLKHCFQACLVGSVLAGGCNRQEVPLARTGGDLLPPVSAWAQKDTKSMAAKPKRVDNAIMPTAYTVDNVQRPTSIPQAMPTPVIPPVVIADPPMPPSATVPQSEAPMPLPTATVAMAQRVPMEAIKPVHQDEMATGTGQYGHAEDYSWVRGEVRKTRKGWHLRYASLGESDPHGGSVTLADDGPLSELKEGEVFVVKGRLQDPNSRASSPNYVVIEVRPAGR